jgi:outer membrane lipoprotein SlyB
MMLRRLGCGAVLPVLLVCGCSSMSNTDKGVLGGGAIGAGTGALVGSATGHAGAGALIGGAVGAVTGGLVGNAVDKSEERTAALVAASNGTRGPLGITDVASMTQAHVSDEVIISQIRATGSVFRLSSDDIIWLKRNGVSDPVLQEMQASASRYPATVYAPAPVYVAEPAPVYVGFGYYRHRW